MPGSCDSRCAASDPRRSRPGVVIDQAPASGITLNAIGATYFSGAGKSTAPPSCTRSRRGRSPRAPARPAPRDPGQAAAGHRLIRRGDHPDQLRLVVQHLEHRHGDHRGAVRAGDDAFGTITRIPVEVDLRNHSGTSGSLRQAEELSMTTRRLRRTAAPAPATWWRPEENSAMSNPLGRRWRRPRLDLLPAERSFCRAEGAEAKNRAHCSPGSRNLEQRARITWPT